MGQLSTAELEVLCGGGPEVGRAQTRMVQLLDLAYRMGLLSSGGCDLCTVLHFGCEG